MFGVQGIACSGTYGSAEETQTMDDTLGAEPTDLSYEGREGQPRRLRNDNQEITALFGELRSI